jgi:hypothetical protein
VGTQADGVGLEGAPSLEGWESDGWSYSIERGEVLRRAICWFIIVSLGFFRFVSYLKSAVSL